MLPDVPVTMPRLAWAKAWEWENLGPAHPIVGPAGLWVEDAARLDDGVRAALAEPGFVRRGRITPEFRDVLLTVAEAERECYGWSAPAERAILTAAVGRNTVKIIVDGDWLTLEQIPAGALIIDVLDELPDCPGADFAAFTVPRAEYRPNKAQSEPFDLDTSSDYTAPDPAERLSAYMTARRDGTHQLYTAVRTSTGRRPSVPLTATDTRDFGRVLTYLRPGGGADLDIACVPGHRNTIADVLAHTLEILRK
jgi:hypothetical protein